MKIVTWNCNGGFRNKVEFIDSLQADILVIQECEDPAQSTKPYQIWAGESYLWKGESKNKGIGVFAKNGHSVTELNWEGTFSINGLHSKSPSLAWHSSALRLFLPFQINGEFTALGVWTKGAQDDAFGYMGQFWKYLQIHRERLSDQKTIIIGDFNSNSRWDKQDRWWNHSDVISELGDIGVTSLYHETFNEPQGQESRPTFYLHRNVNKPYHIDYVFVSKDLLSNALLTIPTEPDFLSVSDHLPLLTLINS